MSSSSPAIASGSFVAPNASVTGAAAVYDQASVWYNATLRGDPHAATLGFKSALCENATLAATPSHAASAGHFVTIGPNAVVEGATLGDSVVVGANAVVGQGAVVGAGSVVQDGAVVGENVAVPGGEVWGGNPAAFVRKASEGDAIDATHAYEGNVARAKAHAAEYFPQ